MDKEDGSKEEGAVLIPRLEEEKEDLVKQILD
jgi:hypothetical protein